jgi:hypothetical protein
MKSRAPSPLVIFGLFISSVTFAEPTNDIVGSYKSNEALLILKPLKNEAVEVNLRIGAPTAGSSCGGGIVGNGILKTDTLSITSKVPEGICTIVIKFAGKTATVVSESDGCSAFHGAGCSFEEVAVGLKRK